MRNIILVLMSTLILSCSEKKPQIKIGVSGAGFKVEWGYYLYKELTQEFSLYQEQNIEIIIKDANLNLQTQKKDIDDLSKMQVNVLIVFPLNGDSLTNLISSVYDKGIPVILIDRKTRSDKYTVFIGNDNLQIGNEAAKYALNKLNYKGHILEIKGAPGSTTAKERSQGFYEVTKPYPQVKITSIISNWMSDEVERSTDSILRKGLVPDLIYSHNDIMAQVAGKICKKHNLRPIILGIDGLPIPGGGLDMVLNKEIDATFYNRPGGHLAIQLAMDIVDNKKVEKEHILNSFPIDQTNAKAFKIQYNLLFEQQEKIDAQRAKIGNMANTIKDQRLLLKLSITLIFLVFMIAAIISYFLKKKQEYIKLINEQKTKIEDQMQQQKVLTDQLKHNNTLLKEKQDEILQQNEEILQQNEEISTQRDAIAVQNEALEKYKSELENIVNERTKELVAALQKAEESDRLKTSFLSNLSHELRTPLNAILGFSTLICQSDSTQYQKDYFRSIILQNSNMLLNLINDIIEISQVSTGQIKILKTNVSVTAILNELHSEIIENVKAILANKPQKIDFRLEIKENVTLYTDPIRIKQVLKNLINNSLKFTNAGAIEIGYEVLQSQRLLKFYVKDTGIGIKKEYQNAIFDKFRKVEDNTEVLYRGSGIGLTISKHLVELLGGSIWVESELNKGSVFYFTVPGIITSTNNMEHAKPEELPNVEFLKGVNILIAEDEESNYLYLDILLRRLHINTLWAHNGSEAIDICKNNPQISLVLMDIYMPVMNGKEAMKKIKELYPHIRIIALTAYVFNNEKEEILDAGFDGYIAKPIDPNHLISIIGDYLKNS